MSDAQFMPTADEELYIPESVIESSATQEELDIWIKAEVERPGAYSASGSHSAQIRTESPASEYQMFPCSCGGQPRHIGASSTMCGTRI